MRVITLIDTAMKPISIFLLLFFSCCSLFAQEPTLQEQAQSILMQGARINHFNRLCPQEKVYLHFDNTAYFQGETIWFSANVVKATDGTVADSKVLYVELLSPTGVVLRQQKLQIEEGRCHGSFPLVDASVEEANAKRGVLGYPSGYYEVRAYTRAMLNFDSHGCFSRVFPVYKAPEKEGDYDDPEMEVYKGRGIERPETMESEALNVVFLPEGGHLVMGISNRVAFKATDKNGQGVDIESMTTTDGTPITLSPQHRGMGSFLYTPTERNAKVKARYQGKEYTFTLPKAENEGYALQIEPSADGKSLQLSVSTPNPDASPLLGYTMVRQGKCERIDTLTVGRKPFSRTIPTHKLPTGVYQFALFDAGGTLYATRMLFVNNGTSTTPVSVTTDKQAYAPFEKVRLRLQVEEDGIHSLSLAVRDASDYGTGYSDDLRTYMLLSSELKGYIEHPEYYFEADDEEHRAALDRLMLVQGWSRYDWQQMSGNTSFEVNHYTEGALVLDGWALHPRKDEPMAGIEVKLKLYSPDRKQMQEARVTTDERGYWGTILEGFDGEWDLNLQTYQEDKPIVARLRLERATAPGVIAYETGEMRLQHRLDSAVHAPWVKEEKKNYLGSKSIVLDQVEVEGRRRYIDYCTFQAFNVTKDAELMTDKGEYTYTVADYLMDKGYDIQLSDGESWEQYLADHPEKEKGVTERNPSEKEVGTNMDVDMKFVTTQHSEGGNLRGMRANYYRWMITKTLINGHRTFWLIKEGDNNSTEPSSLPGYDIDIADVKSLIVYDKPNSFMGIEDVTNYLDISDIRYIQKPEKNDEENKYFPAGMYVVEIHLHPGRKSRVAWNKNTRQTSFDGYSPKMEFYAPQYPDGPIEGDADYRRTIYWNPDVKTDKRGTANLNFYNNGYSQSLNVSVEGMTNSGTAIIRK